jgi:hypothetical protein
MKTHEQITAEQQIENQKAEIESLNRKVASLEKELQKCLDPDSGEINPSLLKHGERGLLQQIDSLQRKLDECPETSELIRDKERVLESRIYTVITSTFLPIRKFDKDYKLTNRFQAWWYFRSFLFECPLFFKHWQRLEFRQGVDLLNDICQATEDRPTKLKQFDKFELASRLFGYYDDLGEVKIRALQELIQALLLLIKNEGSGDIGKYVSPEDLNDMLAALRIIAFCQRLWQDATPEQEAAAVSSNQTV